MLTSNVFARVDSYEKKLTLHLASLLVERTIYGEPKKENEKMSLPYGRLYRKRRSINAKNVSNYCVRKTCVKRKEKIVTVLNTHTHTLTITITIFLLINTKKEVTTTIMSL